MFTGKWQKRLYFFILIIGAIYYLLNVILMDIKNYPILYAKFNINAETKIHTEVRLMMNNTMQPNAYVKIPTPMKFYYVHTYIHSREEIRGIDSDYIRSWVEVNRDNTPIRRIFWDNDDVRKLVKCHFREYEKMANSISNLSMSDLGMYVILYQYGGIYVDTDVEALKPLNDLYDFVYRNTTRDTVIIGSEPVPHIMSLYKSYIGNVSPYRGIPATGVMISESGNKFFIQVMNTLLAKYESLIQSGHNLPEAWIFSGPILLRDIVIDLYKRGEFVFTNELQTTGYSTNETIKFEIISSETFYPEMANFLGPLARGMVNEGKTEGIPKNIVDYVKQWYEKYPNNRGYTNNTFIAHHWRTSEEKSGSKNIPLTEILNDEDIYFLDNYCRK